MLKKKKKNEYYAGIMPDAPDVVLCPKLCRHNTSDPQQYVYERQILLMDDVCSRSCT